MRAVVFDGRLRLKKNVPIPEIPEDWARIRVQFAGICGTDVEILKGYQQFKGVLGHEFVGVVDQCGSPEWVGRRVVGEINVSCGSCQWCKRGLKPHCARRQVLGIHGLNGCMADYCILPISNLVRVPSSLSKEQAVLIEPLSAACRIPEQIQLAGYEHVVVLGDGPLGILCAWVLGTVVSHVTLVGHHPHKTDAARWRSIKACNAVSESLYGADVVVEATGSGNGLSQAVALCRPRGTIVLKSTVSTAETMNLSPLVVSEQTLVGSRCGNFKAALKLLKRHPDMPLQKLITATYPIEHAKEAFARASGSDALKVALSLN
ncbi:MAG: alcohol dehydrogenase catalytic domain-containing protein [Deltaproteobacteria bacterium]|nr:alcohol dehydrogenase catalytic domain-containing protein [Deltaproteobacteria bacterium]